MFLSGGCKLVATLDVFVSFLPRFVCIFLTLPFPFVVFLFCSAASPHQDPQNIEIHEPPSTSSHPGSPSTSGRSSPVEDGFDSPRSSSPGGHGGGADQIDYHRKFSQEILNRRRLGMPERVAISNQLEGPTEGFSSSTATAFSSSSSSSSSAASAASPIVKPLTFTYSQRMEWSTVLVLRHTWTAMRLLMAPTGLMHGLADTPVLASYHVADDDFLFAPELVDRATATSRDDVSGTGSSRRSMSPVASAAGSHSPVAGAGAARGATSSIGGVAFASGRPKSVFVGMASGGASGGSTTTSTTNRAVPVAIPFWKRRQLVPLAIVVDSVFMYMRPHPPHLSL